MSILELAKQHFKDKLDDLQCIEVPEWGDSKIYFRPTDNVAQRDKYFPLVMDGKQEGFVETIIARALTENGMKLFKPKDKSDLMKNVDPDVIAEVATQILGLQNDDETKEVKEAEKN